MTQDVNKENIPQAAKAAGGASRVSGLLADAKAKDAKGTVLRFLDYVRPHRLAYMASLFLLIATTLIGIFTPKILGHGLNLIGQGLLGTEGMDFGGLIQILVILAGLYLFNFIGTYASNSLMVGVSQGVVSQVRREMQKKLSQVPLSYFDQHSTGDLLSRLTNDADNIAQTLQQTLTSTIISVLTMLGAFIMMLTIDPLLTLISTLVFPLATAIVKRIVAGGKHYFVDTQKHTGSLNGLVEEVYSGHEVVRAYGMEADFMDRFKVINESLYQAAWKSNWLSYLPRALADFVSNFGFIMICVIGGYKMMVGNLLIGDVQAFIAYSRMFTAPIQQILGIFNSILAAVVSAERVFEFLDAPDQVETGDCQVDLDQIRGDLIFTKVKFGYTKEEALFENLDLEIQAGDTVAIVGQTGSGKTSLVNLLMRFYEIDGGSIRIDGVDIRDYTRASLRSAFGMVLQDTWLFQGTVYDNIAYGAPLDQEGRSLASPESVRQAAKKARAHDFIEALPQGYETLLREDASNLSQGQKQLITIARAFMSDPKLVILDEATSSVDTRTEVAIQKAMGALTHDRTSIIIAHRLSTIRNADLILVLGHGRVLEAGDHQTLMTKQGAYAQLYNAQL